MQEITLAKIKAFQVHLLTRTISLSGDAACEAALITLKKKDNSNDFYKACGRCVECAELADLFTDYFSSELEDAKDL